MYVHVCSMSMASIKTWYLPWPCTWEAALVGRSMSNAVRGGACVPTVFLFRRASKVWWTAVHSHESRYTCYVVNDDRAGMDLSRVGLTEVVTICIAVQSTNICREWIKAFLVYKSLRMKLCTYGDLDGYVHTDRLDLWSQLLLPLRILVKLSSFLKI